jgi:hypothetical protein
MLMLVSVAAACSCAPRSPAEAYGESDGAIMARLVKVLPQGSLRAVYRYEVRRVYRGAATIDAGEVLSVHSARRAAACALPRRIGHSYGLFLTLHRGRWYGGICGVVSPKRMRAAASAQLAGTAPRAGCR